MRFLLLLYPPALRPRVYISAGLSTGACGHQRSMLGSQCGMSGLEESHKLEFGKEDYE